VFIASSTNTDNSFAGVTKADPRIKPISPELAPLPATFSGSRTFKKGLTVEQLATFNQQDLNSNPLPTAINSGYKPSTIVVTEGRQGEITIGTLRPETAPTVTQSIIEGKASYFRTLSNIKSGKVFTRQSPGNYYDLKHAWALLTNNNPKGLSTAKALYTALPRAINNPEAAKTIDALRQDPTKSHYLLLAGPDGSPQELAEAGGYKGLLAAGIVLVGLACFKQGGRRIAKLLNKKGRLSAKPVAGALLPKTSATALTATGIKPRAKRISRHNLRAVGILSTGGVAGMGYGLYSSTRSSDMKAQQDTIVQALKRQGVPDENIHRLFNPTKEDFDQAVNKLATTVNANPKAVAQVYISAHGFATQKPDALPLPGMKGTAPVVHGEKTAGDADFKALISNNHFKDHLLEEDDLKNLDEKIDRPLAIVLDSCYSGAAVKVDAPAIA
jgi:hypothetical protein